MTSVRFDATSSSNLLLSKTSLLIRFTLQNIHMLPSLHYGGFGSQKCAILHASNNQHKLFAFRPSRLTASFSASSAACTFPLAESRVGSLKRLPPKKPVPAPAVPAAAAVWFLRARRLSVSLELNELLDLRRRPKRPVRVVGLVVPSTEVRFELIGPL